jgi:acyl dehydratase
MTEPKIGDAVPLLEKLITTDFIMAYGAATWDWHRMHYDDEFAREQGLPGVVLDGQAMGAIFARALTDGFGPGAFVTKLSFRNRAMVAPGDMLRCEGEVASVEPGDGGALIGLTQRITAGGRIAAEATSEIRLADKAPPAS